MLTIQSPRTSIQTNGWGGGREREAGSAGCILEKNTELIS